MTTKHVFLVAVCAGGGIVWPSLAQGSTSSSRWRVSASYRALFNIDASFVNEASGSASQPASVTGRSYQDGFVATDSTGNALDLTTHWGYERADQVAGDSVVLRDSQPGDLGQDQDLWFNGFELAGGFELGRSGNLRYGLEGAVNYSGGNAEWAGPVGGSATVLDAFALGGITPPLAPYAGPPTAGPGLPLLGTNPESLPLQADADLDSRVYGFRLGPYLEVMLWQRVTVVVSGGFATALIDGEFTYQEFLPAPFDGLARSAEASNSDWVFGGYASLGLHVDLGRQWAVCSGIQYQSVGDYELAVADKAARLDLGNAFACLLGIERRF